MTRAISEDVLLGFAKDAAREWQMPNILSPSGELHRGGPEWVLESMYNFHFKDEFDFVRKSLPDFLPVAERDNFERAARDRFTARDAKVFETLLRERLAISPDGDHIDGAIGCVEIGRRVMGRKAVLERKPIVRPKNDGSGLWEIVDYRDVARVVRDEWPVYEGEGTERAEGRIRSKIGAKEPGADPWPNGVTPEPLPVGATNPNFSATVCQAMLDAIDTDCNKGASAATIRGRTGAQPADPDASETGTLLFTLTMSATAFGAAADDTDGTCSLTAASITDDSSADATNTLTYCRAGATGAGADDTFDGSAGTSSADFIFNTVSIVSGSTVSMTSLVIGISQGGTAT